MSARTMRILAASLLLGGIHDVCVGTDAAVSDTAVLVRNEDELRAAAARAARGDLNILIDGVITVRRGVYFSARDSIVRLMGTRENAGIRFDMVFDGNWANPGFRTDNGIHFNCRQAIVRGLTFSGYEWSGAVIKGHCTELLAVTKCRFFDIGRKQYKPRREPPADSSDWLYNHCIAAHEMNAGHISVTDCEFERCVWSSWAWSHCMYISARSVLVSGNRFIECGNPFAVGGQVRGASVTILDNEVLRPHAGPDQRKTQRFAFFASLDTADLTAIAFNRLEGQFECPWTGQPNPPRHLVDYNDYSGAVVGGGWAADTTRGKYFGWEDWQRAGFDRNSRPPKSAPARAPAP